MNYQYSVFFEKSKLYSTINSLLTKTCFKLSKNLLTFTLMGNAYGLLKTEIPVSYEDEDYYFSVDFSKWLVALRKFSNCDFINFDLSRNTLKIYSSDSKDFIDLGIVVFTNDSSEANIINRFIEETSSRAVTRGSLLTLNDEILNNLRLADSFFGAQGTNNSIGLGPQDVMYSDPVIVLKANFSEDLPQEFFKNLKGEDYVYIHTFTNRMLNILYKTNPDIYFFDDYEKIYWRDEDTALVLVSEPREIVLPTAEEFQAIQPQEGYSFVVSLKELSEDLDFFEGFYDSVSWQPIIFNFVENEDVLLEYKRPVLNISRNLKDVKSPTTMSFTTSYEFLLKVIRKISSRFSDLEDVEVFISFDDSAPGIYVNIGDVCEFVLSKVSDNME